MGKITIAPIAPHTNAAIVVPAPHKSGLCGLVARDALIREALVKTRDEHYYVPLHYQMRPWAMKKNVTAVYNTIDLPESRYAVMK